MIPYTRSDHTARIKIYYKKNLVDEFGVNSSAISAWERNKTTPAYLLIELAKKIKIVDEIFERPKIQSRQDEISDIWGAIKEIRGKVGLQNKK